MNNAHAIPLVLALFIAMIRFVAGADGTSGRYDEGQYPAGQRHYNPDSLDGEP